MLRLLRNRDVILVLALLTGLGAGQGAAYSEPLVLPALGLVMTLSVLGVPLDIFRSPRAILVPTLLALAANFLLLGGLQLGLSRLLIQHSAIRDGFVILAVVPPAVAVIPFTHLLGGDRIFSLLGTVGCYLSALAITPISAWLLLSSQVFVHPYKIAVIVAQLILLPLLLAALLQRWGWDRPLAPYKGTITNWSFFLITYTIVGLNRQFFLQQPLTLLPVMGIALATTFVWGEMIEWFCRWRGVRQPRLISLVLLGTLKNYGLAGGLALALFSPQTSVPAAVSTVFMIVYIIWLNLKWQWVCRRQARLANL
ncbi:MAG: hypothetical protein ACUVRZ_03570 [Desulfobacca sp.]|uniref:hypothetical protein n=1 Tax=Desulfobacca sp. TaxID=2067990 RepID=UPI004049F13E